MSRIGKLPIPIPQGVTVDLADDGMCTIKGPKGELSRRLNLELKYTIDDGEVRVERPTDGRTHRAQHGLHRTLIANMVEGVSKGFEKELEIVGVGWNAQPQGKTLRLNIGYCHPVDMTPPDGVDFEVNGPMITITSWGKISMDTSLRTWNSPNHLFT